jgi:hypothetical protein
VSDQVDRWDRLFADLEAEALGQQRGELQAEVSDRTRREVGSLKLADRTRSAIGCTVALELTGCPALAGMVREAGPDWLLLADPAGAVVIPLAAVTAIEGLTRSIAPPADRVAARSDLRHVLRGLSRDRRALVLGTADGRERTGTIDRVGADFIDLALHPVGEARRASVVIGVLTIPLSALARIRMS